ncbi:MAG: hypothetical protein J0M19_14835, partial [Sphingomonadales bacterium]|nr:hypothetical protein [Sphingomonadales bacterium]
HFLDLGPREPIAQAEHHDQACGARPEHLLGVHPRPFPFGQDLRTGCAGRTRTRLPGTVTASPSAAGLGIQIGRQPFDFVDAAVGEAKRLAASRSPHAAHRSGQ